MLDEVIEYRVLKPGMPVLDGTLGGAGHARAICERIGPTGLLIACDQDPAALAAAEITLNHQPVKLAHTNFCEAPEVLEQLEIKHVNAIVLDLGL